jgi:hypothetical protein
MHCFILDEEISKSNGKLSAKHTPLPLLEFLDKHS